MRLEFGNKPITFRPASLVFETQQELDDLKWLATFSLTIPAAIVREGYPIGSNTRAYKILKIIFAAIDGAQTTNAEEE